MVVTMLVSASTTVQALVCEAMLAPYKQRAVCAPWEATVGFAVQLAARLPVPSVAVLASAVLAVVCVPTPTVELATAAPSQAAVPALTSSLRNHAASTSP